MIHQRKNAFLIKIIDLIDVKKTVGAEDQCVGINLCSFIVRETGVQPFQNVFTHVHKQSILSIRNICNPIAEWNLILLFQLFQIAFIGTESDTGDNLSDQILRTIAPLPAGEFDRGVLVYTIGAIVVDDPGTFTGSEFGNFIRDRGHTDRSNHMFKQR